MSDVVISCRNLTKYYGKSRGIEYLNMEVLEGEVFGFLGPNGAGKTTTLRTLLGLIHKTSGEASVFGLDPDRDSVEIRKRVAYLPGELGEFEGKTVRRILKYLLGLYGTKIKWSRIEELATVLRLPLDRKMNNLSKGNKQKVGVVLVLVPDVELLMLDEPTSGLDPLITMDVYKLLTEKRAESGCTILLSSHLLGEVEKVADRVGIIRDGSIAEVATLQKLKGLALKRVELQFDASIDAASLRTMIPSTIAEELSIEDTSASLLVNRDNLRVLLKILTGVPFTNLDITSPDLEEIFLKYYSSDSYSNQEEETLAWEEM
ncbi:MAG: ABC transporter ATP-binding protein [Candidatus Thorarchaeota archaeon]|jgi:ABC-2 type transport system ATP-binding protein